MKRFTGMMSDQRDCEVILKLFLPVMWVNYTIADENTIELTSVSVTKRICTIWKKIMLIKVVIFLPFGSFCGEVHLTHWL